MRSEDEDRNGVASRASGGGSFASSASKSMGSMTGGGRAGRASARAPPPRWDRIQSSDDSTRVERRESEQGEVERRREALASEGERHAVVDVGGSRAGGRVGGVAGSRRAGGVVVVVVGDVVLERAREAARAVAIASAAPAFAVAARCGVLGARAAARSSRARRRRWRIALDPSGTRTRGPRAVPEPALRARPRRVGRAQAERPERPGSSSPYDSSPANDDRAIASANTTSATTPPRSVAGCACGTAERGVVPQRFRLAAHRDEI